MYAKKHFTIMSVFIVVLLSLLNCAKTDTNLAVQENDYARLRTLDSFQYPLEDFFPDILVTPRDKPVNRRNFWSPELFDRSKYSYYHAAEDCFVEPGTPVYAIGDGIIRYSGTARGYGGLMIIDHPTENVYSLYGHLSTSRWKKGPDEVKKGELIAYVGTAKEGQVLDSHLHFGIRKGQKGDYWRFGNKRWTAGWVKSYAPDIGWLEPSKIIDPDLYYSSRQNRKSRKDFYLASSTPGSASDFTITEATCSEIDDIYQIIQGELGDAYRLADWNDLLPFESRIEAWSDSVGIQAGDENSLLISKNGERFIYGLDNWNHHYLSRFNHSKPEYFAAWDALDNCFICLGAWHKLDYHILAVRK